MNVNVTDGGAVSFHGRQPKRNCACRALALYLGVPYAEAHELLLSVTDYAPEKGVSFHSFRALMEDLGIEFTRKRVRLTAKNPQAKLPDRAILRFNGHLVFYADGVIHDGFDTLRHYKQTYGWYA